MAYTSYVYPSAKETLHGYRSFIDGSYKVSIVKPGMSFNSSQVSFLQIQAFDSNSQLHYPSGGILLPDKKIRVVGQTLEYLCGSIKVDRFTGKVAGLVVYLDEEINPYNKPLVTFVDFGTTYDYNDSMLILSWGYPLFRG